jgi:hypothetical protein
MTTAATLQECLFSFHGMALRYVTSCPALMGPVTTFLKHSRCDSVGRDSLTIQFEEVGNREDVPLRLSPLARQGVCNKYFHATDLYPESIGGSCVSAIMLFPHVADMPYSCLEPLSKSRALEAMMPQAAFVYDRDIARREFQALSRLVQQVDCYRLHFWHDVLDLPKLITPLLERS